MALQCYVVVSLFAINRRLSYVQRVIHNVTSTSMCMRQRHSRGTGLRIRVYVTQSQRLHDNIQLMYRALFKALRSTRAFYNYFFCLEDLLLHLMPSINMLLSVTFSGGINYILFTTIMLENYVLPLYLIVLLKSEFYNMNSLMKDLSYENYFSQARLSVKCGFRDITFDCGYIKIDFSLFVTAVNFFTLFVFAMIK